MSYQAGTYEVCCDCGVLIPLHRLPEHPVICNQVNDETYPDFLDGIYESNTKDLIDRLIEWTESIDTDEIGDFVKVKPKIMAMMYEIELRSMGGLD